MKRRLGIMDIEDVLVLINKVEKIVGTCFYDEDEVNGDTDILELHGSSDTRVISMAENNDINYALSKQEFAARSTII